jgi:hypothetical protein
MASSLNDLAKEVRGSRVATERVADSFEKWFKTQERSRLDQLEKDREAKKTAYQAKAESTPAAEPQEKKQNSLLKGLASPLAGFGVGAAAKGLGVMGAGIGAFFLGMAGAEAIMGKFAADSGGENIKNLMINTAEGLKAFAAPEMLKFGALLAGGALFGAVAGPRRTGYAAIGMGAMGFGLGAFLTGFSVADFAIEKTGSNGANLPIIAKNIYDTISIFTKDNVGLALGGLVGAGGLLGAAVGGGRRGALGLVRGASGMIGSNMVTFGIGAALGSFFAGFAAVDSGTEKIGDGSTIKKVAENLKGTLEVFKDMTWITPLIAAGGILGAVAGGTGGGLLAAGGAVVGANMVTFGIGAAIGAFFAGFAAVDGVTAYLTGDSNGEGLRATAKSMAASLTELGEINAEKVTAAAGAISAMGGAMFKFFGAQGLGTVTSLGDAGLTALKNVWNWITGKEETTEATGPIANILKAMAPLESLNENTITNANTLSEALDKLFTSFSNIASIGSVGNFGKNMASMVNDLGFVLNVLPALINGGKVMDGTQNWLSGILGTDRGVVADFGGGLKNLKAEDLKTLKEGVDGLYKALGVQVPPVPTAEPISDVEKQLEPAMKTLDAVVSEIREKRAQAGANIVDASSVVTNIEGAKQINIQNGKGSSVATADEAIGWSNEFQRFM